MFQVWQAMWVGMEKLDERERSVTPAGVRSLLSQLDTPRAVSGSPIPLSSGHTEWTGMQLSLLGTFTLSLGDREFFLSRGSERLLALLAIRQRTARRAAIAGMLWSDSDEPHTFRRYARRWLGFTNWTSTNRGEVRSASAFRRAPSRFPGGA